MRFKSQSELPMNGEGYFWSHEELCSRRGQVVEVVIPLVLSSGNPEWLDVDLAEWFKVECVRISRFAQKIPDSLNEVGFVEAAFCAPTKGHDFWIITVSL